jgi:quercetin dioxygenase-like cupin family protein
LEISADLAGETAVQGERQTEVRHVPARSSADDWGPAELMTFWGTGEETGSTFFLAEVCVVPGGGTPPHIHHREDESLQMLQGMLTIQVGGNTITARARLCLSSARHCALL